MFGLKLSKAKSLFFDSKKVIKAVDRATRQVLSKFGAFVRRTAKTSIRKRRAISRPGQPPSSHTGLLRRFIFFSFDRLRRSVVIGPTRLNRKNPYGPRRVPELLEHGGDVARPPRGRTVSYAARPYMGPALLEELPGLPAMWRNSVVK